MIDRLVLVLLVASTATVTTAYYGVHGPALHALLILAVVAAAIRVGRGQRFDIGRAGWLVSAAFLVYALVAVLSAGLVGFNAAAVDRLENFTYFLGGAFLVPFLMRVPPRPAWFWYAIAATAALSGLYAAWELLQFGPAHRAAGSKGKAIPFGDIATLAAVMTALGACVCVQTKPLRSLSLAAAALFGGYASLASDTRGAWIYFPAGFVMIVVYLIRSYPAYRRRVLIGALTLGLGAIAAGAQTGPIRERIADAVARAADYRQGSEMTTNNALGERFEMWRLGLAAFREHPLLGIGVGQLNGYFQAAARRGQMSGVIAQWDNGTGHTHAHNDYIHVLATRGLLGLVSLLLVYLVPLSVFARAAAAAADGDKGAEARGIAYAGVLLVLGYMHFSLTDSVLLMRITAGFFVLLCCWLAALVLEPVVRSSGALRGANAYRG